MSKIKVHSKSQPLHQTQPTSTMLYKLAKLFNQDALPEHLSWTVYLSKTDYYCLTPWRIPQYNNAV